MLKGHSSTVDTAKKTYNGNKWELSAIPFVHAIATLGMQGENPENMLTNATLLRYTRRLINQSFHLLMALTIDLVQTCI